MESDELSHLRDLWRRELMLRVRLIDSKIDRLLADMSMSPTPTSPPSSSSQTVLPSKTRWRSFLEPMIQKFGREALTSIALWIGSKIAGSYLVPGLLFVGGLIWAWIRSIGG